MRGASNTWICFHCECAPLSGPSSLDDADMLAELEWSDDFVPPSKKDLQGFWKAEHEKTAVEYAKRVESDERVKRERKLEMERQAQAEAEAVPGAMAAMQVFFCFFLQRVCLFFCIITVFCFY